MDSDQPVPGWRGSRAGSKAGDEHQFARWDGLTTANALFSSILLAVPHLDSRGEWYRFRQQRERKATT